MTRPATALALGTLAAVLVCGCSGSGSTGPSSPVNSTTPVPTSSEPSTNSPTSSGPTTVNPNLPSLPALPTDLASAGPCAHAGSAFTAASIYLGLAQLGRADEAQRCVQGASVTTATTTGLAASGVAGFYRPTGSTTGSSIRFTPALGGTAVTVTATPAAGGYVVTAVRVG